MMPVKVGKSELSSFDLFVLKLLDRAGSLDEAKSRFARSLVTATIRETGSQTDAATRLKTHRNTVLRYARESTEGKKAEA